MSIRSSDQNLNVKILIDHPISI